MQEQNTKKGNATIREALIIEMAAVRERRLIRNVADGLIAFCGISSGNELVALIGDGTERDNRQAVIRWVTVNKELIHEAQVEGRNLISYLFKHLRKEVDLKMGIRPA